ncbi:putative ribonuclease H-like domain-containing protein [Tanacetum coccineum]|uniref:Ribonuclease H-like domain-containing protein n=1 Tax=Tanacetum coccineum TaxID=301880 RepID=A0ABQ5GSJ3_9ASTR
MFEAENPPSCRLSLHYDSNHPKKGEYDLWCMKMRQYIAITDHILWDIITYGDQATTEPASSSGQPSAPKTSNVVNARRNNEKALNILLSAIPDRHLLSFHDAQDAKSLWAAIKARFGGNKESKKMQKNLLKQQFETFVVGAREELDSAYDRFQNIISMLELYDAKVSCEDANLKFLRSLPSVWHVVATMIRGQPGLDELDFDDLYNNLKVYEHELKGASSSNSQSIAFMSAEIKGSTSRQNEIICSFFAQQASMPETHDDEDLLQIDDDAMEEIDIRWQVAMITARIRKQTGNGSKEENSALEGFNLNSFGSKRTAKDEIDWTKEFDDDPFLTGAKKADNATSWLLALMATSHTIILSQRIELNIVRSEESNNSSGMENFDWADVAFTGIDELAIRNKVINKQNSESSGTDHESCESKNRDDLIKNKEQTQNTVKSNTDRNKVIIEDWVDSDDEEVPLGFSEIKKQTVLKSETSSENKSPRSKDSFGQRSRRRGLGYRDGKVCFVCYSPDHLIKDCDLHERNLKQTQKPKPLETQGSRDSRSVWNNTSRVNHRNFSSDYRHPHQRRSFIPSAVLTREGLKSTVRSKMSQAVPSQSTASAFYQNTARPNVSKAVLSQSTARPYFPRPVFSTSTGRPYYPRMDNVRPRASSSSPPTGFFNTRTVDRPKSPKPIIKSKWVKKESTAGTQAVLPQTKGEKGSVVTSPTQTWRPKGAYLDHRHKNNGSYTLKKFEYGNPEEELKDHAIIDSGCSGSMTGDKDKLSDFKDYKGGYVAFGNDPKGGRITGKGTIKTSCIDFENVSYVKELKFNLLSVSQICDKKHNVLFTDTECLILSPEFKIVDENLVLLRAPRKNDVYSLNLKSIISSGGVTCLVARASEDEAILWHRRLGHVNFKNINKLVKSNLVRGLPSKIFKHDHSCLACRKGKQHKASCKKLEEKTVREPLELLHMDLFGPVSVASLNKKKYCLVVTDDCSRFSWVFFLVYKDETYDILHDLIVGLENKVRRKVKTIRCDNGTEFKNKLMNEFCAKKGIQREYSIARTPQQNGVAERKNRTLIEAARTMLADSLLPIQFWAEAVHTACYVLNRVLVTKPQMKTPYELLMGKSPNISFMKPFGCPLTILNTMDHLSKFEGKSEEGYLLGYSTNSKGFRVYNRVTRKVQDCLHVDFLEDQMNQKGKGPDWMFDLDILSPSLNYIPVRKENQVDTAVKQSNSVDFEDVDDQQFIVHGSSSIGNKAVSKAITNDAQNMDSDESTVVKEVPLTREDQDIQKEFENRMLQEISAHTHMENQGIASKKRKEKGKEIYDLSKGQPTKTHPLGQRRLPWRPEKGWRRMAASEVGDWLDPVKRSIFGVGRKTLPEKFSGGGWPEKVAGAGGDRVAGEGEDPPEENDVPKFNKFNKLEELAESYARVGGLWSEAAAAMGRGAGEREKGWRAWRGEVGGWLDRKEGIFGVGGGKNSAGKVFWRWLAEKVGGGGRRGEREKLKQTQKPKPLETQGSRDSRSVWNNTSRVNHRNFSSDYRHPHQRRSFIPSAVLTREGLKSTVRSKMSQAVPSQSTASAFYQNTARPKVSKAVLSQSTARPYFPRPVFSTSTGRPYYPRMDNVRPRASSSSPPTGFFNTRTVDRPKSPKPIIKSKWVKKESTAGTQAVLPQTKGEKGSVVTSPTQTWRPKGAYLDHRHKNNGSYTLKKFEYGNPEEELKDHAIIDSGCSGSMTGDKDKLSDFKDYKGGYVAFGNDPKGGRITGKGTIKTSCIDFENVSYVKELKFNLLSVSQICDKKHNVLFTDTECLILSPEFKIVDENLVLLRAPRKNDVYSLNLKNIIPSGGVTCLVARASEDEAILWHRRLGHVNFKNINKLVKSNLVRGLPSKTFKHDHSCLACRKGKQHKASCKKLEEKTVREPLELLHMDLFGPVSVASLNRKKYCLVVTDDCSRFSWVFFLVYKDETYDILHDLIVGLENKLRRKVKTIRCAPIRETEFKNKLMNEFCAKKGIQREYSIARTPQQNGVAERKNRTLIEAARTMLADSLLPIQFWAEAVHTACYVLNRVLVTKPQMKTPYELVNGKSPNIKLQETFEMSFDYIEYHGSFEQFIFMVKHHGNKAFSGAITNDAQNKDSDETNARRDCFIQSYKSVVGEFDLPDVNDLLELNGSIRNKRDERVSKDTAGIFISQDKYVKGFLTNLTSNNLSQHTTPIEAHKARGKKMKKARFKSTPEKLPTHVEKRLFRYLKHQPKLVYGNPKDLPYSLRMPFHDSGLCWDNHDRRSLLVQLFGSQYWNDEPIATFKGRTACKVWTLKEDLMLFLRGGIKSEMIDFLRYDEIVVIFATSCDSGLDLKRCYLR